MMNAVDDKRSSSPTEATERDPASEQGTMNEPMPETADPRTTIAGRYSVDLGSHPEQAGIAVVYQGRDLRTREPILVKTLRLEYRGDPELRARFRREARLLQFLSHPHVIRALTFTEERGAPWLVLERVPGRSLRETIAGGTPLSPEEVVPLLGGMAAALDHLHARGLVHLDVRPENITVSPNGEVKLIDFGLAQTAGILQEHIESGAEQLAYLAPEQVTGKPVTVATDVYALGCVVYELLTGRPPFLAGETPAERNAALRTRLEQSAMPPTAARGSDALPAWVDEVVLGAIEREPRQRYSSAGSFAAVFRSGVEGDVDVETGRPRMPEPPKGMRQFPLNEPAIAVKGSRRLSARRGAAADVAPERSTPVVEATYSPLLQEKPISFRSSENRFGGVRLETLVRRLWQAVIVAAILNLLLVGALVVTRGEVPGVWRGPMQLGPGVSVSVAGAGLVARAEPSLDAAIVADLPDGGEVRISGEAVPGEGGRWWPVEVATDDGPVSGYVPESWVQQP
jgi:serine/threonine protein kinase